MANTTWPLPVLTGDITFSADGHLESVVLEGGRVHAGRNAHLHLEDSQFEGAEVWAWPGGSISGQSLWVDGISYAWLRAVTDAGIPSPPNPVEITLSTFHDVPALTLGALDVTLRHNALTGWSGAGSSTSLLMEDCTLEGGGGSVDGGTATLRRVTGSNSGGAWSFSNLGSLLIEDSDLHNAALSHVFTASNVANAVVRRTEFSSDAGSTWIITAQDTNLTLEDCEIDGPGNHVEATGSTSLTVTRSTFSGATDSALMLRASGATQVSGSTFTGNDGGPVSGGVAFTSGGGAVFLDNAAATLTVSDSTFSGNTSTSYGGALFVRAGTVDMTRATFAGNTAAHGGAISAWASPASVSCSACTIRDNDATYGGAWDLRGGSSGVMSGGSLHRNAASSQGGAVFVAGPFTASLVDFGSGSTENTPHDLWFQALGFSADFSGVTSATCNESGCF